MGRSRNPKWNESNLMAKEGIDNSEKVWKVVGSNPEYMRIWNRKTGAEREIAKGGKIRQWVPRIDVSEDLAREMRSRREVRG